MFALNIMHKSWLNILEIVVSRNLQVVCVFKEIFYKNPYRIFMPVKSFILILIVRCDLDFKIFMFYF